MAVWASALAAVLATWWVLLVLLAGTGLLASHLSGRRELESDAILLAAWVGIAIAIALLQLWNFFLPIRWPAAVVLAVTGVAGLVVSRHALRAWLRRFRWRRHLPVLVLLAGVVTYVANRSMGPLQSYDSGSYHIPVIEWARAYPVVPGLANLHGRLAFNNSSLLLAALLNEGPWAGRANHLANGFIAALLLTQIVLHAVRLPRATGAPRLRYAFDLALLTPIVGIVMPHDMVTSYAPDVPAAGAVLVAVSLLVGRAAAGAGVATAAARYELVVAATLLALAASIKLSLAFPAVLMWGIAFRFLVTRSPADARRRGAVAAVLASAAIVGPWLVRGAVLSGYPLYPSTVIAAPVDWRVPEEQAHAELAWIGHFARSDGDSLEVAYPDRVLLGWEWLGPWSSKLITDRRYRTLMGWPLALSLVMLAAVLVLRRRAAAGGAIHGAQAASDSDIRGPPFIAPGVWWVIGCAAAGSVFWFLSAPRVEFGFAPLWALAAASGAVLFVHLRPGGRATKALIAGALVLGVSPVVGRVTYVMLNYDDPLADRFINTLLVRRGRDRGFHPPDPPPEPLDTYVTSSGLLLYVPTETNRCFDAPLPCTPHPSPNLRLRGDDLGDGFRVEGPWLAERWPNPESRFLESWRAYLGDNDAPAAAEVEASGGM